MWEPLLIIWYFQREEIGGDDQTTHKVHSVKEDEEYSGSAETPKKISLHLLSSLLISSSAVEEKPH